MNIKKDGLTSSHIAVLKGDDSLLSILIREGHADLSIKDSNGRTPFDLLELSMNDSEGLVHQSITSKMHPMREDAFAEGRRRCAIYLGE